MKDDNQSGLTLVLTTKWMMVAKIKKPYMETSQGYPCFLDGFAYCGLASIQVEENGWPTTAFKGLKQRTVFDSLAK